MDQVQTAIERWQALQARVLELPSGAAVKIRLPDVARLMLGGVFPRELDQMVLRYVQGPSFRVSDLGPDELRDFVSMRDRVIAESVVELRPGPEGTEWEAVDLRPFAVDLSGVMPIDDLDVIGLAAMRHRAIEAINAQERARRLANARIAGIGTDDLPEERTEAAAPVAGDFRGVDPDAGSGAAREDGADVRVPA